MRTRNAVRSVAGYGLLLWHRKKKLRQAPRAGQTQGGEEGGSLRWCQHGKKVWASEDWWSEAEWGGAACWAKLFNQNFIRANLTSTISWSTIWSVYPVVDVFEGNGDSLSGDGYWGPGL